MIKKKKKKYNIQPQEHVKELPVCYQCKEVAVGSIHAPGATCTIAPQEIL